MRVLNLLASGGMGGIERLCKDITEKSDFENRLCFLFSEGKIYEEMKSNNLPVFSLKNRNKNINLIVKDLVKYCQKEKIDIITVHHGGIKCNIIYLLLKNKLPNVKFVRYLHGCYDNYTFGKGKNKVNDLIVDIVMRRTLKKSDLIIYISNACKISFEKKFNLKDKKRATIYNGISNAFFESPIKSKFKTESINVIYIGRLVKVKGVDRLINVISSLDKDKYNINLTIVGEGEERKNLELLVKEKGVTSKVNFTGIQSNVIEWLDKSDIFVYPSIWEEAFGISVIEAMARGCIPLVSNRGGLPEVVDYNNMYLFNNEEELKQKIIELKNSNNVEKLIKDCVEQAKKFSIDNTINKLEKEYKELLDI